MQRCSTSLCTTLSRIGGRLRQPCEGILLTFFLWFLQIGIEKMVLLKSIAVYQVPGTVMICSSKDTVFETAAAIGITPY
jgi:hypothetical protein